jgi:hypothetical protein
MPPKISISVMVAFTFLFFLIPTCKILSSIHNTALCNFGAQSISVSAFIILFWFLFQLRVLCHMMELHADACVRLPLIQTCKCPAPLLYLPARDGWPNALTVP